MQLGGALESRSGLTGSPQGTMLQKVLEALIGLGPAETSPAVQEAPRGPEPPLHTPVVIPAFSSW